MANEIRYNFQTILNNGDLSDTYSSGNLVADQATPSLIRATKNIGTSQEAIPLGDVTTPGWAVFQNLDDTNFIEIGLDVGGFQPFIKLEPGYQCVVPLGTSAPYARADTAAADLFYIIYSQ
jgi:hypothetical protein